MLSEAEWAAIGLTIKLASVTSVALLVICVPLAWGLARWRSSLKPAVMALMALPLVLPPTVIGFYLLLMFAPDSALGQMWQSVFNVPLAFSFSALVIGSVIYSLPFALQPLYTGMCEYDQRYDEVSKTLQLPRTARWLKVTLPALRPSLVTALGLSFAHTLGEFGVVLMIGGSIPGQTQVVSILLYEQVEMFEFASAHRLSLVLLILSFVMLFSLYRNRSRSARWKLN